MVPETSPEKEESVNTDPLIRARCDAPVCVDTQSARGREVLSLKPGRCPSVLPQEVVVDYIPSKVRKCLLLLLPLLFLVVFDYIPCYFLWSLTIYPQRSEHLFFFCCYFLWSLTIYPQWSENVFFLCCYFLWSLTIYPVISCGL